MNPQGSWSGQVNQRPRADHLFARLTCGGEPGTGVAAWTGCAQSRCCADAPTITPACGVCRNRCATLSVAVCALAIWLAGRFGVFSAAYVSFCHIHRLQPNFFSWTHPSGPLAARLDRANATAAKLPVQAGSRPALWQACALHAAAGREGRRRHRLLATRNSNAARRVAFGAGRSYWIKPRAFMLSQPFWRGVFKVMPFSLARACMVACCSACSSLHSS